MVGLACKGMRDGDLGYIEKHTSRRDKLQVMRHRRVVNKCVGDHLVSLKSSFSVTIRLSVMADDQQWIVCLGMEWKSRGKGAWR
jgi:hypothetical protein